MARRLTCAETEAAKETALDDAKAADRMVFSKETKV